MRDKQTTKDTTVGGSLRQTAPAGVNQEVDKVKVTGDLEQQVVSTHLSLPGVGSATGKVAIIGLTIAAGLAAITYFLTNP